MIISFIEKFANKLIASTELVEEDEFFMVRKDNGSKRDVKIYLRNSSSVFELD